MRTASWFIASRNDSPALTAPSGPMPPRTFASANTHMSPCSSLKLGSSHPLLAARQNHDCDSRTVISGRP